MNPLDHTGIAYREARRFWCTRLEKEDLEQAALVGLCLAALRYDPEGGATFATVARYHVRGELLRLVAQFFRTGSWGSSKMNQRIAFRLRKLERQGNLTPETARAALEALNLTEEEVHSAMVFATRPEPSLDSPGWVGAEGDATGHELIPAPSSDFDARLEAEEWERALEYARVDLPPAAGRMFDKFFLNVKELARAADEGRMNIDYMGAAMGHSRQAAHVQLSRNIRPAVRDALEAFGMRTP